MKGCFRNDLAMLRQAIQDMLPRCQLRVKIGVEHVEDVGSITEHRIENNPSNHDRRKRS